MSNTELTTRGSRWRECAGGSSRLSTRESLGRAEHSRRPDRSQMATASPRHMADAPLGTMAFFKRIVSAWFTPAERAHQRAAVTPLLVKLVTGEPLRREEAYA